MVAGAFGLSSAPRQAALQRTLEVTLDGSGNGTVQFRPQGETWYPALISVKVATNTLEAQCRIYCGPTATDANYVDGTLSGSTGDSTDRVSGYVISNRQTPYIFAVWTGGDAGAIATASITGAKDLT